MIKSTELPAYARTNESLPSIVNLLNPSPEDNILAIGGSGDQAFALLKDGVKIDVIEYNLDQLNLINKRINYLREDDIEDFLIVRPASIKERIFSKEYFKKGRIKKVKRNLENLSILEPQSIFSMSEEQLSKYNKFYLSNALEHIKSYNNDKNNKPFKPESESLRDFSKKLKKDSLICVVANNQSFAIKKYKEIEELSFEKQISFAYGGDNWGYMLFRVN
ncbi:MAG: hypothetical protein WC812_00750 [Candidatus Pacearchaeota archaeon]|jgi:hypothetical protein